MMDKTDFRTIDEYIAASPKEVSGKLEEILKTIREAAPDAEEVISYRMPTFRQNGVLVHFAAFTHHISLFPAPSGIKAFEEKLAGYKTSKGTIQFPNDRPIPLNLITDIVKFRLKENLAKVKK